MHATGTGQNPSSDAPGHVRSALRAGDVAAAEASLDADTTLAPLASRVRATAAILDDLGLGAELRVPALLYACLDAGLIDEQGLRDGCDADTVALAIELTRLGDFSFPAGWDPEEGLLPRQAEALRRMLLAVVADVRLVLVRMADQLVRLRQARDADDRHRQRLALETREIYAPLANRMGIWQLKWQLEDWAFRYLEPETYRSIASRLRERREDRETYIAELIGELRAALADAGIHAEISGRPKHIFSIWRKMQRKRLAFEELFDLLAVRVLVDDVAQCYAALGIVHSRWTPVPGEFDDYIARPKENAYQSLHTAVLGPGRRPVEVQIRTHDMHRQAELGVAAHWRYKEGGPANQAFDTKIARLRALLEPEDGDEGHADLIDRFRGELFDDRIFVFSPRGDVVELPAGATPLDFAYTVHTEIGHHCRGARVNEKMVPLTHVLASGDRVEIITSRSARPSRDWLSPREGYLVSGRNRARVRAWFRRQDQSLNRRDGRAAIDRELSRLDLRDFPVQRLADALGYDDIDALALAVGAGDITLAAVTGALLRETGRDRPAKKPRTRTPRKPRRDGVRVEGMGDLMVQYARCCRPVPPEPIAGYITVGRGVSIHRDDCASFHRLVERHPERMVAAHWGDAAEGDYTARVRVDAEDRQGLLRDISGALADERVSILSTRSRSDESAGLARVELAVQVAGLEQLDRLMRRLERIPSVIAARRA